MKRVLRYSLKIVLVTLLLAGAFVFRAFYLSNAQGLTINELNVYNNIFNITDVNAWKSVLHGETLFSLYTLIISCWNKIVSTGSYDLRLLSVIFGIITCFIAYFSGSKINGFFCLILFSINSFLINFSQEVGMYSLLGLFSTLNIVSLLNIKNNDKGYIFWFISGLGMILTSVTSFLFVLFEVLIFLVYKRNREFFITVCIFLISFIPYLAYILFNLKKYVDLYIDINYDCANIFAALQNLFSPKLIEISMDNFSLYLNSLFYDMNFYSLVFIIIPIGVSLYFIFYSFIKDKFNIILFSVGILYVISRILLQMLFGINFEVGEYIVVLPLLLILMASSVEKDIVSIFLISLFLLSNLYYLITQENSAIKNSRFGVLGISDIVNMSVKDNDLILTWTAINDFDKALYKKVKVVNLYDEYIKNSAEILDNKNKLSVMNNKERKDFYRGYFLNKTFSNDIISKTNVLMGYIAPGSNLYLIYPKKYDVDYYSFLDIVSKDFLYYTYTEKDLFYMQTIAQINKILIEFYVTKTMKDNIVVMIYKK